MQPREKDVVLKCGCVTSSFGAIRVLGNGYEEQACDTHNGWFKIMREANDYERFKFYVARQAITSRDAKRTLGDVYGMPASDRDETEGTRTIQSVLF